MNWITFKIFDNLVAAHMLMGKLQSEGIECKLVDHNIVAVDPLCSYAVGGIKLQLDKADLEKAQLIVAEIEEQPETDEHNQVITCPNCNSNDIKSGYSGIKSVKALLAFILSFATASHPFYVDRVYHCNKCSSDFKNGATEII